MDRLLLTALTKIAELGPFALFVLALFAIGFILKHLAALVRAWREEA